MQAVIRTGGKQYYVTAGDILEVEKLVGDVGDTITLDDVLMIANDEDVTVGRPTVDNAAVMARITGQYRGNKIMVFRYRPKKRIRVRRGHRQYITRLEIKSIKFGNEEYIAPAPAQPEIMTPEPVVEDLVIEDAIAASAPVMVDVSEEAVDVETAESIVAATTEDLNALAQNAMDADDDVSDVAGADDDVSDVAGADDDVSDVAGAADDSEDAKES